MLVDTCVEKDVDTALALLERCCFFESPALVLLRLPDTREEQEEIRPKLSGRLARMLELLCSGKVLWQAGRCPLGQMVACADARYKSLSWHDLHTLHECGDWAELPVAPSQEMWRQARAVLGAMPEHMPDDEQVKRMNLAIFSPKRDIDVLMTYNDYREGTVASMVTELAGEFGAIALSDHLASGTAASHLLKQAVRGAQQVGVNNAKESSSIVPTVSYP